MVVGITGSIGSGKSFVSKELCSFPNTIYYHADEEAKKLMHDSIEIKKQIIEIFGEQSYVDDRLNSTYISSIVFQDSEKLKELNSIVHPLVKKHFQEFIAEHKERIIIYENAILFEVDSDQACDFTISITAPIEERIKRVMERDRTSEEEVLKRMRNQWTQEKKSILANYVIENIEKETTLLKIKKIHNILTKKQSFF